MGQQPTAYSLQLPHLSILSERKGKDRERWGGGGGAETHSLVAAFLGIALTDYIQLKTHLK